MGVIENHLWKENKKETKTENLSCDKVSMEDSASPARGSEGGTTLDS